MLFLFLSLLFFSSWLQIICTITRLSKQNLPRFATEAFAPRRIRAREEGTGGVCDVFWSLGIIVL